MSIFGAIANTLTGGIIGQIGDVLSKTNTTDKERLALQQAIEKQVQEHVQQMENLALEREKIAVSDRDSARKREIEVKDVTPMGLAFMLSVGFFGLLAWMMSDAPPQGSRDILNIMLGSLGTGWTMMLAYYFGSSSGSAGKDKVIADSIKTINNE
jgi:uncharacterized membrane protein